jgi:uncharacterized protein (TIGR03032 family)
MFMSTVSDSALLDLLNPPAAVTAPPPMAFHYQQTDSFVALLQELDASLLVSTYQANKLLVVRASGGGGLSTLVRTFEKPMGIAADARRLAIGTHKEIWQLRNAPDLAPQIEPQGTHDACYVPRSSHVTGDIGVHDIAWAGEELWMVSTRFSCLCTLDADYSFVPRWRPSFVTALAPEDRCHLNGLAMVRVNDGRLVPRFVTALGTTDTAGGWRARKADGGCLIDVVSGELVARELSMPHSPRWHDDKLWLLESGTGSFGFIDPSTSRPETVAQLPGFTRGLAISGHCAFIGLSKIRATSAMDGVPLAERRSELKSGIAVVDLRSGRQVAFLEFQTAVEEIYDVQILPGLRFPEVIGFQKETLHNTFVVPPNGHPTPLARPPEVLRPTPA